MDLSGVGRGFAWLLEWIAEHAPGPRVVAAVEGTRSYGVGVARALTAAGVQVIECEQPARKDAAAVGSPTRSTPIWRCCSRCARTPAKLSTPRADGLREALRILLAARQEMVPTGTGQINRLRALLSPVMTATGPLPEPRSPTPR